MAERPRRVLIVEDHRDLRKATVFLVESWGHVVRSAADGGHGLAIALDWRPDVICLNLVLPGIGGDEVARRVIAALGEDRPVLIAISGYGQEVDRQIASAAGFDAFFAKPYDIELLDAAIRDQPLTPEVALSGAARRERGGR
jgi:CheY-like chemotaxis protein